MKKIVAPMMWLAALGFVFMVSNAVYAADETVTGTVAVQKDEGEVTGVTVTAGEVVYQVKLDEKGKEVAKLEGKKVEVTGAVAEGADGKKVITVNAVKEVE